MAIDPLQFIRAERAQRTGGEPLAPDLREATEPPPAIPQAARVAQIHAMPRGPGDPGYYDRIPPPEKLESSAAAAPAPEPAAPVKSEAQAALPAPALTRLGIYVGRGEDFIVAVETAPEWDSESSRKVGGDLLLKMLPILRELGIKVVDKTGGELAVLEMEHRAQSTQPRSE
jgi:hypothetical protein